MSNKKYTKEHEWVEFLDKKTVSLGITKHAADELGEVVFVELKDVGEHVEKGDEVGSVESVKTVSGIYSCISGNILKVNNAVIQKPELINEYPESDAWLVQIEVKQNLDVSDLMDEEAYQNFIQDS